MMGALDHLGRRLVVHTSKTKRSADFIALLQRLDGLYGPRPGLPITPVVMVLDNGPIHVSKATTAALGARAHWLTVEWLPKYAPELNDIELVWRDLKAHHLAHQNLCLGRESSAWAATADGARASNVLLDLPLRPPGGWIAELRLGTGSG